MGVEDFLSHEAPAPEVAASDEVSNAPVLENESPEDTAHSEDTPPSGLDKRDQAIWREERSKRKELQAQVDQMNQRWQDMMQRMQAPPQMQMPQQPVEEIPAYDEDPLGHLKARNDALERQLRQAQTVQLVQAAQAQQAQQFNGLRSTVDQMETEFAQANPDYHDAVGHLYAQVEKMAEAMGYPPAMKQQIVSQTAMDISLRALQQGKSPAEMAYEAAKQMGWGGTPANEDLPSVESAPAPKPKAAPTSLGAVAGKPETGNPTWDAISKMDDKEFDSWWKKFERQQRGR